jgi:putative SOS response-associated peptidase YedK
MCGRFSLTVTADQLLEIFPDLKIDLVIQPRFNIAPSQPIAVIPNDGQHKLDFYKWGLVPSWSKDVKIGYRLINARAETLGEKPAFRSAYKYRRCLIPADGFYEWLEIEGSKKKLPIYIQMKDKRPFAFAGLWEEWHAPDGSELRSATIITTEPNKLVAKIHTRMPVILLPEAYELWLAPGDKKPAELQHLLQPYPADEMTQYPVSDLVNSPANEGPGCVQRL